MPTKSPLSKSERLIFLDALRGVALCGIFFVNITQMGDTWYQGFPREPQSVTSPAWITWALTHVFLSDTMRALFSMLFGAGLVLMASRGMESSIYWRRNTLLVLFGIVHGTLLLWASEILAVYGVCALLLFPLRKATTSTLAKLAIATLVAFTLLASVGGISKYQQYQVVQEALAAQASGEELSSEQSTAISSWRLDPKVRNISDEKWHEEKQIRLGSYRENLKLSAQQFVTFQLFSEESAGIVFETIATILLGMALFGAGVISGQRSRAFYKKLMLIGYGFGLSARIIVTSALWQAEVPNPVWFELVLYEPARVATALGHIGLFFMLFLSTSRASVWTALARMGQMALTSYIGQSIIAAIIFFGFGFSLFGKFDWFELSLISVVVLIVQGVFSFYWLKTYRFGPLEWLWRSLTYWKLQALK